ncbi:MAG: GUN4 domain-containing protein [Dolichospermum sp.]
MTKVTATISAVVLLTPGFVLAKSQSMTLQESTYTKEQRTYITQTPKLSQRKRGRLIYRRLETLLKAQNFREADLETYRVTLAVVNRESEGWLRVEDIENFPCKELRTIDNLWLKYSQGKFGISVQQEIYKNLGGTRNRFNLKVWESFGDRIGWRSVGGGRYDGWLSYSDLNFSLSAPTGQLPSWVRVDELGFGPGRWGGRLFGLVYVSFSSFPPVKTCRV